MEARFLLQGCTSLVLREDDHANWAVGDINLIGARIARVGGTRMSDFSSGATVFDASGLLVLPGIVDLHGDAFERQIQPRPDAIFSHDIALADTDRQLVANGITTACHGLCYSWEGGLRGRDAALGFLDQVASQRKTAYADHRIHLRFEAYNVPGLADALRWIGQGRIDFVGFNDHMPAIKASVNRPEKLAAYALRARCTTEVFIQRMEAALTQRDRVESNLAELAAACQRHSVPMASHDDASCAQRERYQEIGVTISEFPRTQDALFTAMALDNQVVMGAPNVLLGGSHCGGLATADAVRSNMCDVLVSDYYYPALLQAPFKLAQQGACSLADAWRLVSDKPAKVLGLNDRGRLADGYRADLLLVEATAMGTARLVATIAAGRLVYCAEPERLLMARSYSMAA